MMKSCLPGYVHTNMNKDFHFENMFTLTAESYARSLLGTADKERKTYGCWQHDFQVGGITLISQESGIRLCTNESQQLLEVIQYYIIIILLFAAI